jgi:hypothetical protein
MSLTPFAPFSVSVFPFGFSLDSLKLMQITTMVGSHCDDTHTAFRTDPPLTKEILDCAITHFFRLDWETCFRPGMDCWWWRELEFQVAPFKITPGI